VGDGERAAMSWLNLVEVHHRTSRDHGRQEAEKALAELRSQINENVPDISAALEMARLKTKNPIGPADLPGVGRTPSEYG
jgi:hypothetical protein